MPIFKVMFADNTVYLGGDSIYNSLWDQIPDKEISCLEYFIEGQDSIMLRGYEKYGQFVEATKNIQGPKGTNMDTKLHNIYIMGLRKNKVTSYRIALEGDSGSDKYHKGDITKRFVPYGKEFRGRPIAVWKKGIK